MEKLGRQGRHYEERILKLGFEQNSRQSRDIMLCFGKERRKKVQEPHLERWHTTARKLEKRIAVEEGKAREQFSWQLCYLRPHYVERAHSQSASGIGSPEI